MSVKKGLRHGSRVRTHYSLVPRRAIGSGEVGHAAPPTCSWCPARKCAASSRISRCRTASRASTIGGIVYVIRNGLMWKDTPRGDGPYKTPYNRFVRWSRMGVFDRIFAALAAGAGAPERLLLDTTHLKAHRIAAILRKQGCSTRHRRDPWRPELQAPRRLRRTGPPHHPAAHRGADERAQGCAPAAAREGAAGRNESRPWTCLRRGTSMPVSFT